MTAERVETASAWTNAKGRLIAKWISDAAATAASSSDVRAIDLRPFIDTQASWLVDAFARVQPYFGTGVEVTSEVVDAMWRVLSDPIFAGAPEPLLSPLGDGGLSAEFRTASTELQVEISGSGHANAYAFQRGLVEWEGSLDELPDGIEKWAWRLAHPGV